VRRFWLDLLAGLTWTGVGLMLCRLACGWLLTMERGTGLVPAGAALLLAFGIRGMFSWFAGRNLQRLGTFSKRVCIFCFS
jgi:hypothetical protein